MVPGKRNNFDFLNITHLNQLELKNDDLEAFLDKWEEIICLWVAVDD